jgi:hypothetical protein
VVPAARARHVYSATGGQGSPFKQRLLARNRLRPIVRCMPASLLTRELPAMLAYDLLAVAYGLVYRQPAMVAGRAAALRELPELLRQRRDWIARRCASIESVERLLEPSGLPWTSLREQRKLDSILRERVLK